MRSERSVRTRGVILSVLGILALSPDSLLIRSISVDVYTLVFWRGALLTVGLTVGIAVAYRGEMVRAFLDTGRIGWASACVLAVGTILFVVAILHTSVANVLIITGVTPLLSAVLSLVFLKERVFVRTWVAIIAALAAILVTVWENFEQGVWLGDVFALGAAVFVSTHVVIVRHAKDVNLVPSVAMGGVVVAVLMSPFASPTSASSIDAVLLCVLGLVVLPVAFGLLTLAPRYLPAPEVSLIKLSEMVLGPLWVWLAIGERPGEMAFLGGGMLVVTLVVHTVVGGRTVRS